MQAVTNFISAWIILVALVLGCILIPRLSNSLKCIFYSVVAASFPQMAYALRATVEKVVSVDYQFVLNGTHYAYTWTELIFIFLFFKGQFTSRLRERLVTIILDPQTVLIVHRMSQEILNNALKHSKAENLTISMDARSGTLCSEFKDDGKGFDVESAKNKGGSGLINLQNRADLIGGRLSFSSDSNGSRISIELPIKQGADGDN